MASVFKRGKTYTAIFTDREGQRRTKTTGLTDKATALRIANKWEEDAALRREGVIDVRLEGMAKAGRRTIEDHLKPYEASFHGKDKQYKKETLRAIRLICQTADFQIASDISADGVNAYASAAETAGKSSRTIQAHLTAIKGFASWLVETGKLPSDPLASVKKPNPKANRKRERRMLLPDEWNWLRKTISGDTFKAGKVTIHVTANERLLLYATAIQTGLRSNELRSLTPGKLYLAVELPYIVAKASMTKNAKEAKQYIRPELAAELKRHLTANRNSGRAFRIPDTSDVAAMFKHDLAVARAAWIDAAKDDEAERKRREQSDFLAVRNSEGEVIDFHSLRHTTGAWLTMAGEHPKTVQAVMRHSTITLTMDAYGHLFPGQESSAVAKFPAMVGN